MKQFIRSLLLSEDAGEKMFAALQKRSKKKYSPEEKKKLIAKFNSNVKK